MYKPERVVVVAAAAASTHRVHQPPEGVQTSFGYGNRPPPPCAREKTGAKIRGEREGKARGGRARARVSIVSRLLAPLLLASLQAHHAP